MIAVPSHEVVERIKENDLFKQDEVFNNLEADELDVALQKIHVLQVSASETILNQGDAGDFIVLLLKGSVGIFVVKEDCHEVNIATLEENSFFGEMALIDSTVRMATVRAFSDSMIGIISGIDFWNYFHKNLGMARNILRGLNAKLRETDSHFVEKLIRETAELTRFNQELEIKVKEKTEEIRQKDLQLLELDRIAGIGTLAAGIAHEINNPMSFVKSSISFLRKGLDKMNGAIKYWNDKTIPEPFMKDFEDYLARINYDHLTNSLNNKFDTVNRGIERIITIVGNLKSFSRVDMEAMGLLDVNESIEQTIEILGTTDNKEQKQNIKFVTNFEEIPLLECYTSEINQCLLHTMKNGVDAIRNHGVIESRTVYDKTEKQIIITITDNGEGMSEATLNQAFCPFFTTKPVGTGTGIGLTITERIIKRHGGKISIASKLGEGTTVTMCLPVVK
jgi:signal transduction histidine kinase